MVGGFVLTIVGHRWLVFVFRERILYVAEHTKSNVATQMTISVLAVL